MVTFAHWNTDLRGMCYFCGVPGLTPVQHASIEHAGHLVCDECRARHEGGIDLWSEIRL